MQRRDALKQLGLLFGISVALPTHAFDLGKAIGAAKSLGEATSLSDKDLNTYFKQVAKQYDRSHKIAPAGSNYAQRVASISAGLSKYDGLNLNFKAYIKSEVNAFAIGDGTIRLYSGLMDKMTDDELRYVIGHEIGHIKAGHSKARMKAALTTGALRNVVAAGDGKAAILADSQIGDLIEKAILAQHSQSNENAADDYSLAFLKKRKHAPMAAVTALEKLDRLSGGGGGSWLSTHPAPAARAERMRSKLS